MREKNLKRDSHSERESEEHLQKVWLHGHRGSPGSGNDKGSDRQLPDERSQDLSSQLPKESGMASRLSGKR